MEVVPRGILPLRMASTAPTDDHRSLRIWSAACSTGDEPYTVACCVAACLPNLQRWKVQILGTDIGLGALAQAKAGVFGARAMRLVPEGYRRRFFSKDKDGDLWHARPILTDMLSFRKHNLMEPFCESPFDLVLLKNVLIYFGDYFQDHGAPQHPGGPATRRTAGDGHGRRRSRHAARFSTT